MRVLFGLIGFMLIAGLVQTVVSPKTTYSRMSTGGWIAMYSDGTYATFPSAPTPPEAHAPLIPPSPNARDI